jgi:hypothetical protein
MSMPAALCPMDQTLLIRFGAPPPTWTSLSTLAVSRARVFLFDCRSLERSQFISMRSSFVMGGYRGISPWSDRPF